MKKQIIMFFMKDGNASTIIQPGDEAEKFINILPENFYEANNIVLRYAKFWISQDEYLIRNRFSFLWRLDRVLCMENKFKWIKFGGKT